VKAKNYSINRRKKMSVKKQFKFKHKVRIRDEFVELKLGHGESMFILAIDERGLPHFPERMKRKLPSYVTELAQQTIHHKLWCAQVEGLGMCNCADPTVNVRLWTASEDKQLACDMCSIKSSMEKIDWLDPIGKPLRLRWTNDGERLYWVVGPHAAGSIFCGDCLKDCIEVDFSQMNQLPVKRRPKRSERTKQKSRLPAN
jgi:hypothetical protein